MVALRAIIFTCCLRVAGCYCYGSGYNNEDFVLFVHKREKKGKEENKVEVKTENKSEAKVISQ